MPKPTKPKNPIRSTAAFARAVRDDQHRALARAVKREKDIQRLAAKLEAEVSRTNNKLQTLQIVLGSFSRALATERDTTASLKA